ncbi:unnamed protein product [Ectocarpus fasciculatus]
MALWRSVEDLSGDNQLEASTYAVTMNPSERGESSEDVAYLNWAVGRLFELQVGVPRAFIFEKSHMCHVR